MNERVKVEINPESTGYRSLENPGHLSILSAETTENFWFRRKKTGRWSQSGHSCVVSMAILATDLLCQLTARIFVHKKTISRS